MRTFPQGVVVVTASGDEGPRGITVSSFTSVSLAPPTVLVCILKDSRAHAAIAEGRFVVNVLSDHQGALSDHFARPHLSSDEQFRGLESEGNPPVLEGCLGYLHCRVVEAWERGDHTIFVAEVESAAMGIEGRPLVFCARQYWGLGSTVFQRG
jgi:flavin reductase (DIM6/NTAB) family NADH-FMN oxidoreductase RutF